LNSAHIFDKNGISIPALSLSVFENSTLVLNETAYNEAAPLHLTTYFAIEYMSYFIAFTATITHVFIWYGSDIYHRFVATAADLDSTDVHAKMMVQILHNFAIFYNFKKCRINILMRPTLGMPCY
jgi:magnesium-transporting ATPase (P-type)